MMRNDTPRGHGIRVMLIEDDDADARMFTRAVERVGLPVEIVRATNGVDALDQLTSAAPQERPDCCVLDLNMPKLDGIGFLRRLRADPELASKPVFVLTTSSASRDVEDAFEQNVAAYMVKEVESSRLTATMELLRAYLAGSLMPDRAGASRQEPEIEVK